MAGGAGRGGRRRDSRGQEAAKRTRGVRRLGRGGRHGRNVPRVPNERLMATDATAVRRPERTTTGRRGAGWMFQEVPSHLVLGESQLFLNGKRANCSSILGELG